MPSVECGLPVGGPDERVAWLTRNGPTLAVRIGFDRTYRMGSRVPPNLPEAEHPALVDTGALLSCIDSALAADLNLPVVDREPISGAHGSQDVNVHLAQVSVPALAMNIVGRFHGVHLLAGNQRHLALLGRTFLQRCTMTYDGPAGTVSISRA